VARVARYVVTGAAGFIGSHLVETLLSSDHDVRAVDCFTNYYDPALKEENCREFPVERVDLAVDPLDFSADGIFHLAAQPGVSSFGDVFPVYVRQNLIASQRLFEIAARESIRVVFASSSSVYGEQRDGLPLSEKAPTVPVSPYGVTKLAGERLAHACASTLGLDVVVLRYFSTFGPRQRPDMALAKMASALVKGEPFYLRGDGEQSRNFTYVSDVVSATIAAMERGRGTYNVGGTREISISDAIGALEALAGQELQVRGKPPVPGDTRRAIANTSRLRHDLGWSPEISFERGLRAQWQWHTRAAV
jgi:nucleoside-diphosphate-sugar epimerase